KAGTLTLTAEEVKGQGKAGITTKKGKGGGGAKGEAMHDEVKVTVVEVEITQAPDYLFANARYATPVRFEIGAGSDTVTFEEIEPLIQNGSVKVRFYAADGDGSQEEHLRFTTNNLAPTSDDPTGRICRVINPGEEAESLELLEPDETSDEQSNCYEAYVRSGNYRGWQIDQKKGDKHYTWHAYFRIVIKLGTAQSTVLLENPVPASETGIQTDESGDLKDEGARITLFSDESVPAFDIGLGFSKKEGSDLWIRSRKAFFHSAGKPIVYTQPAGWPAGKGFQKYDEDDDKDWVWKFDHWTDVDLWPKNAPTPEDGSHARVQRTLKDGDNTYPFEELAIFWSGEKHGTEVGEYEASPVVKRSAFEPNPDSWMPGEPEYRHVYYPDTEKECFWISRFIYRYHNDAFDSAAVFQQTDMGHPYKGIYAARNNFLSLGGQAYLSYGPKTPPCFTDSDTMPVPETGEGGYNAGNDPQKEVSKPERAMHLQKDKGSFTMRLSNAGYFAKARAKKPGHNLAALNAVWSIANVGFSVSVVGTPLGAISAAAQVIVNQAVETDDKQAGSSWGHLKLNRKKLTRLGTAIDSVGGVSIERLASASGKPETQRDGSYDEEGQLEPDNQRYGEDLLRVGEGMIMWVDIVTQAKLVAKDGNSYSWAAAEWREAPGEEGTIRIYAPLK
ncbi:MAG: hypothetical protein KGZ25_14845, partial [Planctomycetes bacterium]|nr:hypothetical protein [Planctomycetota bacterium]